MTKTATAILTFLLITLTIAQAQTAADIIGKNTDAVGGKDVLSQIKSVYMEGIASVMGNDLPTTVTILTGKGFKTETNYNGMNIIQCLTDTSGWMVNPVMGQSVPVSLPSDAVKFGQSSLDIRGEIYNYKEKGYTDSLAGREDYLGVSVYKVKLSKPGMEIIYFFDPSTYFILRTDAKVTVDGKDLSNTTTFSDYKKTASGYVLPFTTGFNNQGYDVSMKYTKVEVNKPIDANAFAMPK